MLQLNPITGFHFTVSFEIMPKTVIDSKFQSVQGLKATVGMEAYKEGGQNRFVHQLPTGVEYDSLVLKRCLTTDVSGLSIWCRSTLETFSFAPANLTISLLNEKGNPLRSWYVVHAIPLSIDYGEFNAEENKIVIESITLKYNFFKELSVPTL